MVFLVKKTIGLNQALGFFGLNQTTLISYRPNVNKFITFFISNTELN